MTEIRDRAAIVGVGATSFAQRPDRASPLNSYDLAVEAFKLALEDAGLRAAEIDGLLCSRVRYARIADLLGLRRMRLLNEVEGSGRMSGVALQLAVLAIVTGMADVVACVYGNNSRSVGATFGGDEPAEGPYGTAMYDAMYGMTSPGAYAAMAYRRYQYAYSAPDGALAPFAINNRQNAALNPNAYFQKPITIDEYLSGRFIAEPLRVFDYCMINDGGVAFIVTSPERARALRKPPVYVGGMAQAVSLGDLPVHYDSSDFFYTQCREVARRVYQMAEIEPTDVDCAEIYDNFTPMILFALEGFAHCPRGEGWDWARGGRIGLGGELPVNTSGGHTGEGYMQGWALHVEAVRQVRGEAGARQVPDCEVAQYMAALPIITSHILHR